MIPVIKAFLVSDSTDIQDGCVLAYAPTRGQAIAAVLRDWIFIDVPDFTRMKAWRLPEYDQYAPNEISVFWCNAELPNNVPAFWAMDYV